eukprot:g89.t1
MKCNEANDPENGWKVGITRQDGKARVGDEVRFGCNIGYKLKGNEMLTCSNSGQWSPSSRQPECDLIDCGVPETVENALPFSADSKFSYNETITYNCREGYVLKGNKFRECKANGKWSGVAPECEAIECDKLVEPLNGVLSVSNNGRWPSVARYSCLDGYETKDRTSRVCLATGKWINTIPECRGITCAPIPVLANGLFLVSNKGVYPSEVKYKCDAGFSLANGSSTRSCSHNGDWVGNAPICAGSTCVLPALKAGTNIIVEVHDGSTKIYEAKSEELPDGMKKTFLRSFDNYINVTLFTADVVATYSCQDGYRLADGMSKERRCLRNGSWSAPMPICVVDEIESLKNRTTMTIIVLTCITVVALAVTMYGDSSQICKSKKVTPVEVIAMRDEITGEVVVRPVSSLPPDWIASHELPVAPRERWQSAIHRVIQARNAFPLAHDVTHQFGRGQRVSDDISNCIQMAHVHQNEIPVINYDTAYTGEIQDANQSVEEIDENSDQEGGEPVIHLGEQNSDDQGEVDEILRDDQRGNRRNDVEEERQEDSEEKHPDREDDGDGPFTLSGTPARRKRKRRKRHHSTSDRLVTVHLQPGPMFVRISRISEGHEITDFRPESQGGSPLERAGVLCGAKIIKVNDSAVTDIQFEDLMRLLGMCETKERTLVVENPASTTLTSESSQVVAEIEEIEGDTDEEIAI